MKAGDCPSGSAGNAASVRTFSMTDSVRACACPGGAQRRHLYKDKHTSHRQKFYCTKSNIIVPLIEILYVDSIESMT